MRDPVQPPADFVDFVAGHADRLHAAARTLTDTDQDASDMVIQLFGAAAARWRALRPATVIPSATAPPVPTPYAATSPATISYVATSPAGLDAAGPDTAGPSAANFDAANFDAANFDAAGEYVGRLFRRDAAARSRATRRYVAGAPVAVDDVAEAAWARGRGIRRRRVLGAAGGLAVLAAVPFVRTGRPAEVTEAVAAGSGTTVPTDVPLGLDLLPASDAQARLPWLDSPLPARVALTRPVGTLRTHPIGRALAAFRAPGSPLLLLGPDGLVRQVPDPPGTAALTTTTPWPAAGSAAVGSASAGAWPTRLTATALSPDGSMVAQPTSDGLSVLDIRGGTTRHYPSSERIRSVLWLGRDRLLLGRIMSSVLLSLDSGRMRIATAGGRTTLHPRAGGAVPGPPRRAVQETSGPAAFPLRSGASPAPTPPLAVLDLPRAVELLPAGEPATAPARLRLHQETPAGIRTADVALTGRLTGWLGLWRGVGFLTHSWALRDCTPMGQLPVGYASPTLATVAVEPGSGTVSRLLVTTGGDADPPQLLGVLGGGTALIRARGAAGTLNLIGWRVATGRFYLVSVLDSVAGVSLADVSAW
jgi:hypothetical protein